MRNFRWEVDRQSAIEQKIIIGRFDLTAHLQAVFNIGFAGPLDLLLFLPSYNRSYISF
jgi:hypothetical protein